MTWRLPTRAPSSNSRLSRSPPSCGRISTSRKLATRPGHSIGKGTSAGSAVINATSGEPAQAVARANAVASAYEGYLAGQVRGVLDASVTATTDPQTIQTIRAKAAAFGDGVAVVETAAAGSADSSLTPMRSALLIAAVAALVAIGLALLWRSPPPDGSAVVTQYNLGGDRAYSIVRVKAPRYIYVRMQAPPGATL